ncbi:MAG: hypothetical protein MPJ78_20205 [Hyphomicrobiaceae bacterium]|nr:hypothetical protein [Hyphomicrobiaceae bacterium]
MGAPHGRRSWGRGTRRQVRIQDQAGIIRGQAAGIKLVQVVTAWTGMIHVPDVRQGIVPYSSAAGGT